MGTVALAVEGLAGWTLIDGVDLSLLTPKKAIGRADDVGRTFCIPSIDLRRKRTPP